MDNLIFVDTDVFLKFFVRDIESFHQKAKELFEKTENGELKLKTNDLVIAEIGRFSIRIFIVRVCV